MAIDWTQLAVEHGVPVTPRGAWSPILKKLRKMVPGDSFVVENFSHRNSILTSAARKGFKVTSRKLDGCGYRVWLLKKP